MSEHVWTANMLNDPKHCLNLHSSVFVIYFDHSARKSAQKKFYFSSIWNLQTVSEYIDNQWNVFSLSENECLTQSIQMQFSQNQKIFSEVFSPFPKSTQKMKYFVEKDQPQRLLVSQIIDCKNLGYLSA